VRIKCNNGNTVSSWYDRKTRSSVTQVLDKDGNQLGDADYSGNRVSARWARTQAVKDNGGREVKQKPIGKTPQGLIL
jgi:DNA-binding beta-propeller fold protein YncE